MLVFQSDLAAHDGVKGFAKCSQVGFRSTEATRRPDHAVARRPIASSQIRLNAPLFLLRDTKLSAHELVLAQVALPDGDAVFMAKNCGDFPERDATNREWEDRQSVIAL